MQTPRRILIVRPSALGDVCRSVPVLATLRAAYPDARIDWLVQDTFAAAVEHHPALDGVVPFPRRRFARVWTPGSLGAFFEWSAVLSDGGYDLVVDAQGLARSGVLGAITGAPLRLGYANAQECAAVFYTRRVRVARDLHAVDRMVRLVSTGLGISPVVDMRLHTSAEDRRGAAAIAGDRPLIVLAPTSRWAAKRWPADRFAALGGALLGSATGARGRDSAVVLVGGPGEHDQCGPLLSMARQEPRLIDAIGRTSVGVLMALIERATLVVANDSAALHMAVGFDRPCVALFGPTDIGRVGPFRRERDVIQHPRPGDVLDHKSPGGAVMMERITVGEVLDACLTRLGAAGTD